MSDHATTKLIHDEETLANFVEGRLDDAASAEVEAWLASDEVAFDTVVLARSLMDEEAKLVGGRLPVPAAQAVARDRAKALFQESLKSVVFRLVRGALDLVDNLAVGEWAPVAAPSVRGDSDGDGRDLWEGRIPAGDDTLTIEVERTGAGALIAAGVDNAAGAQIVLLRDGAVVTLRPATAEPAELAEVEAGSFQVEIRRDGETTGRASVVLQAA